MCNLNYTETGQEYLLSKDLISSEELGKYYSYGIIHSRTGEKIKDVTVNIEEAEKIIDLLNKNNVSIIHIKDVLLNILE